MSEASEELNPKDHIEPPLENEDLLIDEIDEEEEWPIDHAALAKQKLTRRIVAGILFLITGTVLGLAIWMNPAQQGHGTHTQLGLNKCSYLEAYGHPCPTCGMTTSYAWLMEGNPFMSAYIQPAGFVLAICTLIVFGVSGYVMVTGSTIYQKTLWYIMNDVRIWFAAIGIVLGAWGYKYLMYTNGFHGVAVLSTIHTECLFSGFVI